MREDIQQQANEGSRLMGLALILLQAARDAQGGVPITLASRPTAYEQLADVCDQLQALYVKARFID
jgi:hypothetical protein